MAKTKNKYYIVKNPTILSEETWEIGNYIEITEEQYKKITTKEKGNSDEVKTEEEPLKK